MIASTDLLLVLNMKNYKQLLLMSLAGVAVLSAAGFSAPQMGQGDSCCAPKSKGQTTASAQTSNGTQRATVTINGGYSPSSVKVKAGKPVELTFVAGKNLGCGNELVFKGLNIKRMLKAGEKTVVKFTPKKGQDLSFTCGMGMYKGSIVIG
jgi:hypothetical protein